MQFKIYDHKRQSSEDQYTGNEKLNTRSSQARCLFVGVFQRAMNDRAGLSVVDRISNILCENTDQHQEIMISVFLCQHFAVYEIILVKETELWKQKLD